MEITAKTVTIAALTRGYTDDNAGSVLGYGGKLTIRPAYQREFVYKEKQRNAVIDSVRKERPLNVMYWAKTGEDTYEVLDGQQRTISISQFVNGDFSIMIDDAPKFFSNLTEEEKQQVLNYELTVFICDGTDDEKLDWFKTINIAGETLTNQELLNAVYTGPWLSDAKKKFSKRNCPAQELSKGYVRGNSIRQEYLERVLSWIADRDGLTSGKDYMAVHCKDKDADDIWTYFQLVISWAKTYFPVERKGLTDTQEWGILYNRYHERAYNSSLLEKEIQELILDDEVTKKSGIIPYILSEKTKADRRNLSLRAFSEAQKRKAYEKQGHKCPLCQKQGIDTEYAYEEMQGDHIIPWSQGGKTTDDNLQMLCRRCNLDKGDN